MSKETVTNTLIQRAKLHVMESLSKELSDDLRYHNLEHTLQVHRQAIVIGRKAELTDKELEILELATLFHDLGFTKAYEGHEEVSVALCRDYLIAEGYPADRLEHILGCIKATHPDRDPTNRLERIVCDADLSNLARPDYFYRYQDLRHEWEVFLGKKYKKIEWLQLNRQFLSDHQYHTQEARELFTAKKKVNLDKLAELEEQARAKKKKKKRKKARKKAEKKRKKLQNDSIQDSRSAQMMFKTALRNHLDLANLADNKANIMLSVNALIITLVVPLGLSRMGNAYYQLLPFGFLLLTCLASMISATMATRPIKMKGNTSEDEVKSGKSNLFFFGNFYKMSYDSYKRSMERVVSDERMLDDSIFRDLYYLGKSLGNKYFLLRVCYTIFMIGITITVIVFVWSYWAFTA